MIGWLYGRQEGEEIWQGSNETFQVNFNGRSNKLVPTAGQKRKAEVVMGRPRSGQ